MTYEEFVARMIIKVAHQEEIGNRVHHRVIERLAKRRDMFHWRDGWFFERMGDASVHIIKRIDAKDDSDIVAETTIPPEEWASIVAVVSKIYSGDTYREALEFHTFGE